MLPPIKPAQIKTNLINYSNILDLCITISAHCLNKKGIKNMEEKEKDIVEDRGRERQDR